MSVALWHAEVEEAESLPAGAQKSFAPHAKHHGRVWCAIYLVIAHQTDKSKIDMCAYIFYRRRTSLTYLKMCVSDPGVSDVCLKKERAGTDFLCNKVETPSNFECPPSGENSVPIHRKRSAV